MAEKREQDRAERTVKKYAAFISYRHLSPDKEIAQALHKMLEHNQVRPNRHVPRNIRPVFLDTGELPILEDLDAGILEALENSDCLYVICSPNLPLSKYCMREIDYFKKIHGGSTRHIYTLLVAGEPGESFPESLRTATKLVRGEDGIERAETVEVEPLFADVRAPSLRESIRKLRRTEYLRLAAAYYGCSYDELYKRRQRWMMKIAGMAAAGALAVAAGFAGYAHVRNLQYASAKAAAYASYAQEAAGEGDELLALTLCEEGWEAAQLSRSRQYMTALRSAMLQHDYKSRALEVAPVMQTAYMGDLSEVFYISGDGSKIITLSDNMFQITDAKTGGVLVRRPMDSIAVDTEHLTEYAVIEAVPDEQGVFHDTLTLRSVADNSVLGSFAFRLSQKETPSYKLIYLSRDHSVMALEDRNERVAYLSAQGGQLTQEQAEALAAQSAQEPEQEARFYVAAGKRKRPAAVKNSAGETMLELPAANLITAFSPDEEHFAFVQDGMLSVYETQRFTLTAQCDVGGGLVQSLSLLRDTDYALLVYRTQDWWWESAVVDWRTGRTVASIPGSARAGSADSSIYSMDGGRMTRSVFNDWSSDEAAVVLAQHGGLCYAAADGAAVLADADAQRIVLRVPCSDPKEFAAADDLSRVMMRTDAGLACYDAGGVLCFAQAEAAGCFALSPDGSLAAWEDAQGCVQVVSAADGSVLRSVDAQAIEQAGWLYALAVGDKGLCAAGSGGAVWIGQDGESAYLGAYDHAAMTADGLIILESGTAYVQDFAVYDAARRRMVLEPQDNTGQWAYSAKTGMLVRRTETSGSHPSLELEVLRIADGAAEAVGRIALADLYITGFHLDSGGETLSVSTGGTTAVWRLGDLSLLLKTEDAPVYLEDGRFWSGRLCGARMYAAPLLEDGALHDAAMEAITGTAGRRTLSLEEQARFSFGP